MTSGPGGLPPNDRPGAGGMSPEGEQPNAERGPGGLRRPTSDETRQTPQRSVRRRLAFGGLPPTGGEALREGAVTDVRRVEELKNKLSTFAALTLEDQLACLNELPTGVIRQALPWNEVTVEQMLTLVPRVTERPGVFEACSMIYSKKDALRKTWENREGLPERFVDCLFRQYEHDLPELGNQSLPLNEYTNRIAAGTATERDRYMVNRFAHVLLTFLQSQCANGIRTVNEIPEVQPLFSGIDTPAPNQNAFTRRANLTANSLRYLEDVIQHLAPRMLGPGMDLRSLSQIPEFAGLQDETVDYLLSFSETVSESLQNLVTQLLLDQDHNLNIPATELFILLSPNLASRSFHAIRERSPGEHLFLLQRIGEMGLRPGALQREGVVSPCLGIYVDQMRGLSDDQARDVGRQLGVWLCENPTSWDKGNLFEFLEMGKVVRHTSFNQGLLEGLLNSQEALERAFSSPDESTQSQAKILLDLLVRELPTNRFSELTPVIVLLALNGAINNAGALASSSVEALLEVCKENFSGFLADAQERWLESVRESGPGDACIWALAQDQTSRILATPNPRPELLGTMGRLLYFLLVPAREELEGYSPPYSDVQVLSLLKALDDAGHLTPVLASAREVSASRPDNWMETANDHLDDLENQLAKRALDVEEMRVRKQELERFKAIPTVEERQRALQDLVPRVANWIEDLKAVERQEMPWMVFCGTHDDWETIGVQREHVEAVLQENAEEEEPLLLVIRSLEASQRALGIIQTVLQEQSLLARQDVALDDRIHSVVTRQKNLATEHELLVSANNMANRPLSNMMEEFEELEVQIQERVLQPEAKTITDDATVHLIREFQAWSTAMNKTYPYLFAISAHKENLSRFDTDLIESMNRVLWVPVEDSPQLQRWLVGQWQAIPNATQYQQLEALYSDVKALEKMVAAKDRAIYMERIRQQQELAQQQPAPEMEMDHWSVLAGAGFSLQNVTTLNLEGFQDFEARLGIVEMEDLNAIGVGTAQQMLLQASRVLQDLLPKDSATGALLSLPNASYNPDTHGKDLRTLWDGGQIDLGDKHRQAILQAFDAFAAVTNSPDFAPALQQARETTGLEFLQKATELFVGFSHRQLISRFALQFNDDVDRWWDNIKTQNGISSMTELAALRGWTDAGNFYRLREIAANELSIQSPPNV